MARLARADSSTPLGWRVDLPSVHCASLMLTGRIRFSDAVVAKLRSAVEVSTQPLDLPWIFGGIYRAGGRRCLAEVRIWASPPGRLSTVQAEFTSDLADKYGTPAPLATVVEALDEVRSRVRWHCLAQFTYPMDDLPPQLPFPIVLREDTGQRSELRGMRVREFDASGRTKYELVMDFPSETIYSEQVSLELTQPLSGWLPSEVLAEIMSVAPSHGGSQQT